jgi:iron complex transport system ATP-binding protein
VSTIECARIGFAYNGKQILDGVDLRVDSGEWVAVIGPNGSGKTTLLRIVAGMVPRSGRVVVDGRPLVELSRRARAQEIAVVPQTPLMPAAMPLLDYVLLGRTPYISYWGSETAADVETARSILVTVDLDHLEARPLGSLSGGERQRAVLARALAQQTPVLLLDEPTTGLDLGHQQRVLDHVDALRRDRGLTVLTALHDLTLAAQYPDRVVLLDAGRVVASGAPAEVLTPERLAMHYGANVAVLRDETGAMVIAPKRVVTTQATTAPSTSDPT